MVWYGVLRQGQNTCLALELVLACIAWHGTLREESMGVGGKKLHYWYRVIIGAHLPIL